MTGLSDHLWRQVGNRAAEGLGTTRRIIHALLTQTKVSEAGVSIRVDDNVVRF